jgi:hypothetical protein
VWIFGRSEPYSRLLTWTTATNAELSTAPIALIAADRCGTHPSQSHPRRTRAIGTLRGRTRLRVATRLIADLGSLVTLSALALLGVAAAAGMIDMTPAAEGPTYSVTFADH